MNIVIIGAGKVGEAICEQLSREGHDIVVIDKDPGVLGDAINNLDLMCVEGDGTMQSVLLEANVPEADLVIACSSTDEINMLACLMAKKMGAKRTAARVRNPEYYNQIDFIKNELGIDVAINPELIIAEEISRVFFFPAALKIETFARGRAELVEFKVEDGSPIEGLTLSDIFKFFHVKILVCAVQRGDEVFIPKGDFVLEAGDRIHLSASHKDIENFLRAIGGFKEKIKTALLLGGGRIAFYLAQQLIGSGIQVKIIEKDPDICQTLAGLLPNAVIINGDCTDQKLLFEEGLEHSDAVAALTGIDEENMIVSLFAQNNGVKKVIAKVNRSTYMEMATKMGLDSVLSPKAITAGRIVSYVRAMKNASGSNLENVYKIVDGSVEAMEFVVRDDTAPYIDKPLRELKLKKNALISCIVRSRSSIIPNGDSTIQFGDSVLVVTPEGTKINDLKDAFES